MATTLILHMCHTQPFCTVNKLFCDQVTQRQNNQLLFQENKQKSNKNEIMKSLIVYSVVYIT